MGQYLALKKIVFFSPWYYKQNLAKKKEIILMQDTAPSHSSKFTKEYLANRDLMEDQDHGWPPNSADLNPIESL